MSECAAADRGGDARSWRGIPVIRCRVRTQDRPDASLHAVDDPPEPSCQNSRSSLIKALGGRVRPRPRATGGARSWHS